MKRILIGLFILTACASAQFRGGVFSGENVRGRRADSLRSGTLFVTDTLAMPDSIRVDDLVAGPLLARLPKDDPATFNEDSITVDFAASGTDIALFQYQLSHATIQDTAYDLDLHVHWRQADTGTVVWVAEYSITNIGGGSSAFVNSTRRVKAFEYANKPIHQITSLLLIPSETVGPSTIVRVKLKRLGSDASDTYPAVARVYSVDIHYPRDTKGGSKYEASRY